MRDFPAPVGITPMLAVLSAPRGMPATVNLLAPVLINSVNRMGAQVFLEGSRFTTRELFVLPPTSERPPPGEPRPEPESRASGAHAG